MQTLEKQIPAKRGAAGAKRAMAHASLCVTLCCLSTTLLWTTTANAQSVQRQAGRVSTPTGRSQSSDFQSLDPELARLLQQQRASESRTDRFGSTQIESVAFRPTQEPTEERASRISTTAPTTSLRATPVVLTEERESAAAKTTNSSATSEMFLDLTQERSSGDESSPRKPVGERGAEVSMSESPVQVLTRAVAWIVIALCLFSLAALGLRRWQRQRGLLPTTNSRSRVIETLSVGPGRTVSLIELAGFRALVASDAGGIKQLVLAPTSFNDEFSQVDNEISHAPTLETNYTEVAGMTKL